jgi:hypothetical protein
MTRPTKRSSLQHLKLQRLGKLCDAFEVDRTGIGNKKDNLVAALSGAKRASLEGILERIPRDELKPICSAHELDDSGEKDILVARLLGRDPAPASSTPSVSAPPPAAPPLRCPTARRRVPAAPGPKEPRPERRHLQPDHQLHLGHRRRLPARPLRPRQVPRRDPADDRHSPPGRSPRGQQATGAGDEGAARQGRDRQPGPGLAPGCRSGLLQHVQVHIARLEEPRQPAGPQGGLRGLPRRLLAERPGDPGELRVPQPDLAPLEGRRTRHPD